MDYMMITLIIKFIIITFTLSDMAKFISELLYEFIKDTKYKLIKLLLSFFGYIFSCDKCFSFWFTILLTQNLLVSCIVSLTTNLLKWIQYKLISKQTQL